MARFEVLGLDSDRPLIHSLAKRLAGKDPDAARVRMVVHQAISDETSGRGGILEALRRSPLVGADLTISRSKKSGRKVTL